MNHTEQLLEFYKIKGQLKEYAYTRQAKEQIEQLKPFLSEREVKAKLKETSEARLMLDKMGSPPLVSLNGIEEYSELAEKGGCLIPEQLEEVAVTLTAVSRLKDFLIRCKQLEISLPYYEENLNPLNELRDELHKNIRGGRVDDYASRLLHSLREDIEKAEAKMREKAEAVLKSHKNAMSENFITMRNGCICLPVKKEYKGKIAGSVIDKSATGSTLFIEPASVSKLQGELQILRLEEENEVRRILYTLTGLVAEESEVFSQNAYMMQKLDFIFAKGKLSAQYDGIASQVNDNRYLHIKNGRHPIMDQEACVPLNFTLGNQDQGMIITGPNTGGKTVAIKTVGLHCLMTQCGLHIPCQEADICLNNLILCDIGDGQNISENLSTFSAHVTNILDILRKAGKESLVIMDELGSGTDPAEGMGIAVAVLEELKECGCLYLVTTHYPEVKIYGEHTKGVINARMAFDKETLQPLYHLEIGESGESCAFYIAEKLGMPGSMLRRASVAAYGEELEKYSKMGKTEILKQEPTPSLQKKKEVKRSQTRADEFQLGDSVLVYPDKKTGIVCKTATESGMLQIQMPEGKIWVNHKRIKLQVAASELYPPDYDFSIIFDTVETRKARHRMEKGFLEEVTIS